MSKYKYRASELQQVNWERVREQVQDEAVVFAVDVAKEDFVGTLMKPDRTVVQTLKWQHPRQSRELVERLQGLKAGRLEAVMEPSGTYGDALRGLLTASGVAVYRVSPKRVHDAAELYDGVPSLHDAKAAYLIGRLHWEGVSQRWVEPSAQRRELQAQLGLLGLYREREQRAVNRLEARLARHWPEAAYVLGLDSVSLLKLLARYGDAAAVAEDVQAAEAQLRRDGGRFLCAEKVARLLDSACTSVGVVCLEAERELLKRLAQEVLEARAESKAIEKSLTKRVQRSAGLAQQACVVGKVTAVVLHGALGDVEQYADAHSYVKAAGLNLKERSSGKHKGQLKLTKRGPSTARRYVYFAVLRLIRQDGPARRWYEAKVGRDGGVKGKAITALMRKLLKALWHVGRGAEFDVQKLFGGHVSRAQAT